MSDTTDPTTQNPMSPTVPPIPVVTDMDDVPPPPSGNPPQPVVSDAPPVRPVETPTHNLDLPPVISTTGTPGKKNPKGRIVATILGFLVLIGGLGAGVILTQQEQNIEEKAASKQCLQECLQGRGQTAASCNTYCEGKEDTTGIGDTEAGVNSNTKCLKCTSGKCVQWDPLKPKPSDSQCAKNEEKDTTGIGDTEAGVNSNTKCLKCTSGKCVQWDPLKPKPSDSQCATSGANNQQTGAAGGCPAGWLSGGTSESGSGLSACIARCGEDKNSVQNCAGEYKNVGIEFCYRCSGGGTTPIEPDTPIDSKPKTPNEPSISAQCLNIKAYDTQGKKLSNAELSQLKAGDKVRFAVAGSTTSGNFTKARFTINGSQRPETSKKISGTDEFYDEYTIPTDATSFSVSAKIFHSTLGYF